MRLTSLFSAAFAWFKELFVKDKTQSDILRILIANSTDADLLAIRDKKLGETALTIVKNLNKSQTLTGKEKAGLFNELMSDWLKEAGKVIAENALNLLRELAVMAVKIAATAAVTALLTEGNKQSTPTKSEAK